MKCDLCKGKGWTYDSYIIRDKETGEESGRYDEICRKCDGKGEIAEAKKRRAKMKKQIPFNDWSKERIEKNNKICTSRHANYLHDKRDWWISQKLPFWYIKKYLWEAEGAKSSEELRRIINESYKRKVPEIEEFYVHFGNFKEKMKK